MLPNVSNPIYEITKLISEYREASGELENQEDTSIE